MEIAILRNAKGAFKDYLTSNDADYAAWLFDRRKSEGDTLDFITREAWDKIAENERYKLACREAAKKL